MEEQRRTTGNVIRSAWLRCVPVAVHDGSDLDARLWQISENLHRCELSVLERSNQQAEWMGLVGEKAKAQVAPSAHTGGRADKGINAAVRDLGVDRTEAQRAVKIAAIKPEAKEAAKAAGLDDNQSALLEVARQPTAETQVVEVARQVKARSEAKSLRGRDAQAAITVQSDYTAAAEIVLPAWNRASVAPAVPWKPQRFRRTFCASKRSTASRACGMSCSARRWGMKDPEQSGT